MEIWDVVTLVLGSNIVIVLSTYFTAKYQLIQSNKRFEKEQQIAIEKEQKQRRREVRSEPLLKLRGALSQMTTRLHKLVTDTQFSHNQSDISENIENKESHKALDDYKDYMTSVDFLPTLYLQYDKELINLLDHIESSYLLLFEYALDYRNLRPELQHDFREMSLKIKNEIAEVQELINKRLEEL